MTSLDSKYEEASTELYKRTSEIKTVKQEGEQLKIKINMLTRQIEDEKNISESLREGARQNKTQMQGLEKTLLASQKETETLQNDLKDMQTEKYKKEEEIRLLKACNLTARDDKTKLTQDLSKLQQ